MCHMRTTRLHPEDIEALASAIADKLRAPVLLKQPAPCVAGLWREHLAPILPTLPIVTTRTALETLGVPTERQDRAAAQRVGLILGELGYRVAYHRRMGPGHRERVYEKPAERLHCGCLAGGGGHDDDCPTALAGVKFPPQHSKEDHALSAFRSLPAREAQDPRSVG